MQRQAALLAFAAFSELKHVILVDEDVDIFDTDDVLWAMQTRYQGDVSTVFIPGVRCHPLDPSQVPAFSPSILQPAMSCKTIFDCTVPFSLKKSFNVVNLKKSTSRASSQTLSKFKKIMMSRASSSASAGPPASDMEPKAPELLGSMDLEVHLVISAGAEIVRALEANSVKSSTRWMACGLIHKIIPLDHLWRFVY